MCVRTCAYKSSPWFDGGWNKLLELFISKSNGGWLLCQLIGPDNLASISLFNCIDFILANVVRGSFFFPFFSVAVRSIPSTSVVNYHYN